jgi:hypothetical protein
MLQYRLLSPVKKAWYFVQQADLYTTVCSLSSAQITCPYRRPLSLLNLGCRFSVFYSLWRSVLNADLASCCSILYSHLCHLSWFLSTHTLKLAILSLVLPLFSLLLCRLCYSILDSVMSARPLVLKVMTSEKIGGLE